MRDEYYWFKYRPVFEGVITFTELHERVTLDDLLDLHEGLDVKEESEAFARKNSK
jgi:hypothetical protein